MKLTLYISRLFSFLRLLNLFWSSSIPEKPSLSPDLSWTTESRKVENILCLLSSSSYLFRVSYFFLSSFSKSSRVAFYLTISSSAFLSLAASFCLLSEFDSNSLLFSLTSLTFSSCSCLYFYLSLSNSLALAIISSFYFEKFSSVSLSSLSF